MAVAVHALFEAKVKPGDTIAVVGLGAIGLLIKPSCFGFRLQSISHRNQ